MNCMNKVKHSSGSVQPRYKMASIIKNQILKHLSKFVKNLSPDKISLSTFKGEGELTNLELDEIVLTDLLALPTWMKLVRATCNRASIRIPWTKLKSVPIIVVLDSVKIHVEACEELRQGAPAQMSNAFPTSAGKYGFVNKVIDGITATVNSVEITFHSQAFESKVEISRIRLESQSPTWKKTELSNTRLKDMDRGETLIFKAMEWQTLRLEARSTSDRNLAPLRLLTNQAKAHIVIKKKLSDCEVLGCRLSLLLDDLLWVLTDSQILAALHFINSISGLIKQATDMTQRFKAARKLESLPEYQAQLSQTSAIKRDIRTDAARNFDLFDVKETSYHFLCEKIDLHFCDDPGNGRSKHEDLRNGGAFQVSLMHVLVDFYPYHLAKGERRSWLRYTSDNALSEWLTNSLNSFRIALIDAVSGSSLHSPLARTSNHVASPGGDAGSTVKKAVSDQFGKLMSTCLVLKIQDLKIYKVTTSSKQTVPQPFLSSYIDRPKDLQTVHAEFTWFYYPGEICFPLPSPKIFAHLYPFQVHLDTCTILWLNSFVSNLQNAMAQENVNSGEPEYMDIRVELIMPKLVFENKKSYSSQSERPHSLHFQVSRLVLSNFRSGETGSLHELTRCLEVLQRGDLAYGTDFPSKPQDVPLIPEKFILHAEGRDKIRSPTKINGISFHEVAQYLTNDMLNTEPRDVWYVFLDPFWADFRVETKRKKNPSTGTSKSRAEPESDRDVSFVQYPFIDSLPISAWLYLSEEPPANSDSLNLDKASGKAPAKQKSVRAIFQTNGIASVQLTHYQYLFLMRMVEALSELSLYLTYDLEQILGQQIYNNLVTALGYIPTVEVNLLFPPLQPDKGDFSSMDPDSEVIQGSSSGELDEGPLKNETTTWKLMGDEQGPKLPRTPQNLPLPVPSVSVSLGNSPVGHSAPSIDSLRSSFSQVKTGLSSLAVTFNKVGGLSTPDSEVASQWSNLSSDSSENNFIPIESLDDEFCRSPLPRDTLVAEEAVEVATEVVEEFRSTPSPSFSFGNTMPRASENDTSVAVLTVRLDNVEVAQEGRGTASELKFQCRSVSLNECKGMAWNDFQTMFTSRNRKWANQATSRLGSPTEKRVIKVRLSQSVSVDKFKGIMESEVTKAVIGRLQTPERPRINLTDRAGGESPVRQAIIDSTVASLEGKVDLRNEEQFTLHMSSVLALADFVEDEILPSPFPIQMDVVGAVVELVEDRPSANFTSPGSVPIKVSIPHLPIRKDNLGIFYIGFDSDEAQRKQEQIQNRSSSSSSRDGAQTSNLREQQQQPSKSDLDLIQADFEKLQRQLEVVQTRNVELENELRGTQNLKVMILQLQEQVNTLQEEKSSRLSYPR